MSYYKLLQVDIIQTSQLYLGGGINAYPPSTGQSLFSDGSGGTYWSTPSGRTTQFTSTVEGLGRAGYISSSQLYSTVTSLLLNSGGGGTANAVISSQLQSTVDNLATAGYISSLQLQSTVDSLGSVGYLSSLQLQSTINGLGTAGYLSSAIIPIFVSSSQLASTVGGLGNANYVCTSQLVSTVFGLGNFYVSTNTYGTGDTTRVQLISTTTGLGNIYLSSYTYPFAYSTQVVSTVDGLGRFYLSTPMIVSTLAGLGNLGYMSTQNITSTVAGLGRIYMSAPDVVLARNISTGVSTSQVSTSNLYASNIYTNNTYTNTFFTGTALISTSFTTQNAPVSLSFTSNVPAVAVSMTGPTGQPFNMRLAAGSGALTLSVDGTSNATIRSEQPGTVTNPLNIQGSVIYENANSNVFYPGTFLANNNTQIIGSTISTGLLVAPQALLSSVIADGSQLYNLTAVSTATMTSTVAGYAKSLNVVSTATLASTIQGLSNIIGYLSAASLGPIVSTGLMTTSSLTVYGNTTTAYINFSNPYTSNIWIAAGAAATPAATLEYSVNGSTWTNAASGGFSVAAYGVAWNGVLWVAVGQDATAANRIQYSSNSSNWLSGTGATFSVRGNTVAWNGSLWVAVGQDGTPANTIKYSANGIAWTNSLGSAFGTAGNDVAWNGRLWVAVGTDSSAANAIRYSLDGSNWLASSATANSSTQNGIAWNGKFWLSGGTVSGTSNAISISQDGINWSNVGAPFQTQVTDVAWNGVLWVATGSDSGIINNRYSYDGYTWIQGTGAQFSVAGNYAAWNGSFWVAGGQDATQLGLLQTSSNGINWVKSTANNFTTFVNEVAYSSNMQPFFNGPSLYYLPQPNPIFMNSTNSFMMSQRALTINNTVYIDNLLNRTGINCNAPSYDLDVYGAMNVSSAIYASTFVGDGSQLINVLTQPFLTSSLVGLGTFGYVSTVDYSTLGSNVTSSLSLSNYISTAANNSTTTYFLTRFATLFSTSTVYVSTAYNLIVSSGQFSSIFASTITTSTLIVSSMNSADSRVQRELVSSIRMFEADGYFILPPHQSSNISTIYLQTSSIQANSMNMGRILLGSNRNQTVIPFYGLSGGYNNTVIMEQSTSGTTQELLLFRGSSTTDQIRIQTTGVFRLETGVSARLYPNNMAQPSSNAALLVDINSNIIFNGTTANTASGLFFNAATNFLGINTITPQYQLDMLGTARIPNIIISSITVSSVVSLVGTISSLTVSSMPYFPASTIQAQFLATSNLITSTISGTSSFFSSLYVSTQTTTANLNTTTISTAIIVTSTLTTNNLSTQLIYTNYITTSTITTSTVMAPLLQSQNLNVSSIQLYTYDGYTRMGDLATSNISTVGLFASSLQTFGVQTNLLRVGLTPNQNALRFYGLFGNFNNTVIMEQSTSAQTQELLLFRGSSINDQVRIQTTGLFRVETGVSARLYPNNMAQPSSNAALLVDINSNIIFNGTTANTASGLFFNAATNYLGINTITPRYPLDLVGTARIPNMIISSITVSTFVNLIGTISSLTVSSMPYFPASTIQAQFLATSNLITSTISGNSSFFSSLYVSTQTTTSTLNTTNISTSIIVTSTLTTNNLSTPWIFTNYITTSTIAASTVTAPLLQSQNINVSSIQLYTYNGYTRIADLATSNISTVGLFASSLQTFGVQTNLLRVGLTPNQNALRFYGLFGNFNNTVIMEQSTSGTTQELLLFKGSSISDQVRIQTTGSFRVETGVSSRLYPNNMNQVTNPTLVIDNAGNFSMNASNGFVYIFATNSVGINLPGVNPTPAYTLDVNGTMRSLSIITSTALISSSVTFIGYVSSFSVSSMTLVPASTVTAQLMMTNISYASTLSATSSIMSTMLVSSLLTTSTFYAVQSFMSTLAVSTVTSLVESTNTLFANTGNFNMMRTSTMSTNFAFTQQLTTSSLNFYNGPGYVFIPDIQASNLSTVAMYTSSIRTNAIFTTRMGVNNSTPLFTVDILGNARISSLTIDAGAGVTSTNTTFSLAVWGAGGPARVGGTTWTQISDERVKENIVDADLDKCYADIKAIPLRRFTYTSSFFEKVALPDRNVLGFIAQEVKQLQPKSVVVGGAFGISDLNWLNIDQMNMSLYGAVKKLMQTNEELTSSVTGLSFSVSTLMSHGI